MKSYWNLIENHLKLDSLNENIETDVCIIGAGVTGLTTGYYLSKSGMKVTILEKDEILSHTSSNTTAKITSQHGLIYKYLIDSKGKEFTRKYYDANEKAIKNIEEIIKNEQINCDFEKENSYVFTENEKEVQKIKDEVNSCLDLKINAKFTTKIDLPINIQGAIYFENQAQFHPKKYGLGLCQSILNHKGKIYENSKAININRNINSFTINTTTNSVKAKYLVIATHYPILNFPGYYFLKMYQSTSYAIALDIGNKKSFKGMYINTSEPIKSFRMINDDNQKLLLIVGNGHKTGKKKDLSNSYNNLEKIAKKIYPNASVKYKWCTEDCITLDKLPYIGDFSHIMKNVFVATGYNKWGITLSNIASNIIKDKILENSNEFEELFTATRVEPIKNIQEVENILKETTNSLITNKFKTPNNDFSTISCNEGRIVEIDGKKIGIYRDENNKLYKIIPTCSHLGCELSWNNLSKTWDCPCHGSRFTYSGQSIESPSIENLKTID